MIIYAQVFGKVHSLNAPRIGNLKFKRRPEIYSESLNMTRNISARWRNRFRCINLPPFPQMDKMYNNMSGLYCTI